MKTAHSSTDQRHFTRYGSQARHLSDLADMDENYFVLLGGQDGWLGSANFIDQMTLWQDGGYIRVPLRPETVHAAFRRRMVLSRARYAFTLTESGFPPVRALDTLGAGRRRRGMPGRVGRRMCRTRPKRTAPTPASTPGRLA